MENNETNELVSLYDYLGKAAGSVLGKQVYEAAKQEKLQLETRKVETPYYTGPVLLYPKQFLDQYFNLNGNTTV